ncbi:hypothetical protein GFS60_02942 [Rhodococcus sp. WAY2]|nr:hypothetical protein GFS60_02942 [Rhodococcus sp. WAY2]
MYLQRPRAGVGAGTWGDHGPRLRRPPGSITGTCGSRRGSRCNSGAVAPL